MRKEIDYFFCYDKVTTVMLKKKGIKYICSALHKTSGNEFWLFERSDMLESVLDSIS